MATITATVDPTYTRIGVQLSGFAADGPIDVYRIHADTSRHLVRGVSAVSGGVAFGWDYEAPLSSLVTYEASSGGTVITSSPTTLPGVAAWLRSPGLPSLDMTVEVVRKPETSRERPRVVLRPFGRESAIVLSDSAKSPEFTLTVRTYGHAQADDLVALFSDSPVALLLMPGAREAYRYVSLGSLNEKPVVDYIAANGASLDDAGGMSEWDIACTVTDSPIGGLFGDPTASYAAVLATYATYTALKSAKATYLDVLKGV